MCEVTSDVLKSSVGDSWTPGYVKAHLRLYLISQHSLFKPKEDFWDCLLHFNFVRTSFLRFSAINSMPSSVILEQPERERMVRFGREWTKSWQDENVDKEEKVGNEKMFIGQVREGVD